MPVLVSRFCWLTLRVLDDARNLALHDGDSRVSGSEIDTNDGALDLLLTLGCSSRFEASKSGCQSGSEGSLASGQGGSSGKLEELDIKKCEQLAAQSVLTALERREANILNINEGY